jgi:hypothetical protein
MKPTLDFASLIWARRGLKPPSKQRSHGSSSEAPPLWAGRSVPVAFFIIWTLFLMSCTGYIYHRFQQEHEDNIRLQQLYYHDTGRIIK